MSRIQYSGLVLGLSALALGLISPFAHLDPAIQRALGFTLFALIFWTTEPVAIELSSLLLLLLLPAVGLLTFAESFSPFADKTIWLVFAGMVLSLSLSETGLGELAAAWVLRILARNTLLLLLQLHILGLLTSLFVPSGVVRILLLMPIGISIVDSLHGAEPKKLHVAILLSLVCGTLFGGFGVLTGGVPNLVVAGQLERAGGGTIFWSDWLVWMFPLIGLGRTLLSTLVIWLLFARHLGPLQRPALQRQNPLWNRRQKTTLCILLTGVALWATDALHQIAPVYIGFLVVFLLLFPRFGPLDLSHLRRLNFPFLFYIAALFSLGAALDASGFNLLFIDRATSLIDLNQLDLLPRHLALTFLAVPLSFLWI